MSRQTSLLSPCGAREGCRPSGDESEFQEGDTEWVGAKYNRGQRQDGSPGKRNGRWEGSSNPRTRPQRRRAGVEGGSSEKGLQENGALPRTGEGSRATCPGPPLTSYPRSHHVLSVSRCPMLPVAKPGMSFPGALPCSPGLSGLFFGSQLQLCLEVTLSPALGSVDCPPSSTDPPSTRLHPNACAGDLQSLLLFVFPIALQSSQEQCFAGHGGARL